jgi:hypothetical protein
MDGFDYVHIQVNLPNADNIIVMENLILIVLLVLGLVAFVLYSSISRDLDE